MLDNFFLSTQYLNQKSLRDGVLLNRLLEGKNNDRRFLYIENGTL